jgi:dihydroorotate dehydrogenase electron transfer subunit
MDNPLHASFYADEAVQHTVAIVENVRLARDTYRVRLACPEIAGRITPGQFLMLRIAGMNDPLIGRPLALYNVMGESIEGSPTQLDVVYLVKGKFSTRLAQLRSGDQLEIWGPLGNGFLPQPTEHLIMVAGGIGQTPFLALAQEYLGLRRFGDASRPVVPPAKKITFCYGARTAEYFAGLDDFTALGLDLRLSTDDGSRGHHGLVTDLLKQVLAETTLAPRIVCCGPERMMEAVSHIAQEADVPCEVSLETPMACGIGICFTCVAMIRDEAGECDYKRTCVEGPVFDAAQVVW